eukprot:CAMPEP_0172830754 /NCGR_PEP_ID=MMETSP1075-20121228/22482_1 /TAXON_ID=2916 /ORGANISM="Ceratium fusus, Strain PA161109" /LENGTH=274 /DNA_ID=CAMNT_0013673093 /DNA_START=110 /DNA_END=931 /DNA_ORIENTATION=-
MQVSSSPLLAEEVEKVDSQTEAALQTLGEGTDVSCKDFVFELIKKQNMVGKILLEDADLVDTGTDITFLGTVDSDQKELWETKLLQRTKHARQLLSHAMALIALAGLAHGGHDPPAFPAIRKNVVAPINDYFKPTNLNDDVAKLYDVLETVYVGLMRVSFRVQVPTQEFCATRDAYAYVQGRLNPTGDVTYSSYSGKPIINICPAWFDFPDSAFILIHEMSHHHPTATEDEQVMDANGKSWSAYFDHEKKDQLIVQLAKKEGFAKSWRNADSYA